MDGFLSLFPNTLGSRALVTTPYLRGVQYQPPFSTFWTKLEQKGLLQAQVPLVEYARLFAAAYQAWLFFGLLEDFFDCGMLQYEDFVEDGRITLRKQSSDECFQSWRIRLGQLVISGREREQKRVKALLSYAADQSEELDTKVSKAVAEDDVFRRVSLSVKLLLTILHSIQEDTFQRLLRPSLETFYGWLPAWMVPSGPGDRTNVLKMKLDEAKRHLEVRHGPAMPLPPGAVWGGPATELLLQMFVDHGWCYWQAVQVCRTLDYVTANYLASMERTARAPKPHWQCRPYGRCIASVMDESSGQGYQTARCSAYCTCPDLGLAPGELASCIRGDRIPLVSIKDKDSKLDIKLVKARPSTLYYAASHVWSDGLGNSRGNTLRHCQLLRIRDQMAELKGLRTAKAGSLMRPSTWHILKKQQTGLLQLWQSRPIRPGKPIELGKRGRIMFWMDTLCIPASDAPHDSGYYQGIKALKQKAIKHITPIYAGATDVLVLDSELQNIPGTVFQYGESVHSTQLAAYIYASNWMQRGWTLEEGSLAHSPVFRFLDQAFRFDLYLDKGSSGANAFQSPLDRAQTNANRVLPGLVRRILADEQRQMSGESIGKKQKKLLEILQVPHFSRTWNSLRDRSLTHGSDAFIIFANLLDFNIFSTIKLPDEIRLPRLIASCDHLPLALMFQTGPRLLRPRHNGWVPTSFSGADQLLGNGTMRRIRPPKKHKLEEENLSHAILEVERSSTEDETVVVLVCSEGVNLPIDGAVPIFTQGLTTHTASSYVLEHHRQTKTELSPSARASCIVMDFSSGSTSIRGWAARGARFGIVEQSNKKLQLQYDAPLTVWTQRQWQYQSRGDRLSRLQPSPMQVVEAAIAVHIEFDATFCQRPLRRRPALTNRPSSALKAAIILMIVVFILAFVAVVLFATLELQLSDTTYTLIMLPLFSLLLLPLFLYRPVRRISANLSYKKWMKTFDEAYVADDIRKDAIDAQSAWSLSRLTTKMRRQRPRVDEEELQLISREAVAEEYTSYPAMSREVLPKAFI